MHDETVTEAEGPACKVQEEQSCKTVPPDPHWN